MKRMHMVILVALIAGMSFPVPAMATLDLDVDFSVLPTDVSLGWTTNFSGSAAVDPDTQVDTTQQIWDMDNVQPSTNVYRRTDHASLQTGPPTQYHGRVVIDHVDFNNYSVSSTEVVLVQLLDAVSDTYVWLNAADGGLNWHNSSGWNGITGLNNTSGVHTYDWLTTISGGNVTTDVWLDGSLIADDIDTKNSVSSDRIDFGDGQTNAPASGGCTGCPQHDHHHIWHTWHLGQGAGEGPIPEPGTMALVGLGSGLMLLRRRRA